MDASTLPTFPKATHGPGQDKPRTARFGFGVGVITAFALVFAVSGVRTVLGSGPKMFSRQCNGAKVTGVESLQGTVEAQIMVNDAQQRVWSLKWDGDSDRDATPINSADSSTIGDIEMFGDVDDGTQHTAYLRPAGSHSWCALRMHVLWDR